MKYISGNQEKDIVSLYDITIVPLLSSETFSIFSTLSFTGSRKLQPGDLFFNPSPFLTIATQKDLVVGAPNKTMFLRLSFFRRLVFAVPVNCAGLAALQVGHHTEWGLGQALWSHNIYDWSLSARICHISLPSS